MMAVEVMPTPAAVKPLTKQLAQFVDTHLARLGITLGKTRDGEG
jgi:hypothetical protein